MRDYSKVSPQFWIGKTGKEIRRQGPETLIVAMYLMTCPQANMLGMFYLPEMYIAHETGLGMEGALKGLSGCIEAGFCSYDRDSEVVWVFEMARHQIADELKERDLRSKGVQNEYDSLPENPFLAGFFDKYGDAFKMVRKRGSSMPIEGAMKALESQEQEQEQEQEQDKNTLADAPAAAADVSVEKKPKALGVRDLVAEGVDRQHAQDWLKARRAKRLPLTATALDGVRREAEKAGVTLPEAIARAAAEGWAGFKASWVTQGGGSFGSSKSPRAEGFETCDYGPGGRL